MIQRFYTTIFGPGYNDYVILEKNLCVVKNLEKSLFWGPLNEKSLAEADLQNPNTRKFILQVVKSKVMVQEAVVKNITVSSQRSARKLRQYEQ